MSIDRERILRAYSPRNASLDPWSPFSVGNGDFAFTCDATGLQTFPGLYDNEAIPLLTQGQWGWHTTPYSETEPAFPRARQKWRLYDNGVRAVPYCTDPQDTPEGFDWLRRNPHRFNLGHIGFCRAEGLAPEDVGGLDQRLDLWDGVIESRFTVESETVEVRTAVLPRADAVALRVRGVPLRRGLGVSLRFPMPSPEKNGGDYGRDDQHRTCVTDEAAGRLALLRQIDDTRYFVTVQGDFARAERVAPHEFRLWAAGEALSLTVAFTQMPDARLPEDPWAEIRAHWHDFWRRGGFVAIGGDAPERRELQRRIVLSQYLTAIQCAGAYPPAETGLTFNSWYGKFHLEMHWWHSAHFPLWQRPELLARSMWYYQAILPRARAIAARQGYQGVRWPKMTDPSGFDSPSNIGPLLIWQQPHPIYYCELLYRQDPGEALLRRYREIVVETARFMADYAREDEEGRFHLGPGMIPAQENHDPAVTMDPPFELAYWAWGLRTAARWLERLGEKPEPRWTWIADHMAPPPQAEGRYLACADNATYTPRFNHDHPSMVAALGFMTGEQIDPRIMENTLRAVLEEGEWQLDTGVWGWDFPLLAMTAARLGLPELAVMALLYPAAKNAYLNNGHNRQADRASLPIYLPGNGGLLTAVAMMCAGWDGGPDRPAPGFPVDWQVEYEGISPMP